MRFKKNVYFCSLESNTFIVSLKLFYNYGIY